MRKYILAVCVPLWLVPMLTSCEVHFGDVHYSNVPWWVIAIPTVLLLLFAWCATGKAIAGRKHYCPKCGLKSPVPDYCITEIDRDISKMVAAHSNNLVKKIASSSKRAQKVIDKYIEKYED